MCLKKVIELLEISRNHNNKLSIQCQKQDKIVKNNDKNLTSDFEKTNNKNENKESIKSKINLCDLDNFFIKFSRK